MSSIYRRSECELSLPPLFKAVDTYLILRNGSQIASSNNLPRRSAKCNLCSPCHGIRVGNPVTNLVRHDLDDRYTRIVLVALVNTIFEVTKVGRDTGSFPCQPMGANDNTKTHKLDQFFLINSLSCVTFAIPQ